MRKAYISTPDRVKANMMYFELFGASMPNEIEKPSLDELCEDVEAIYCVDVMCKTRMRHIAWPRQVAMTYCYLAGYSYPQVAAFFGKDHTTVMHAVKTVLYHANRIKTCKPVMDRRIPAKFNNFLLTLAKDGGLL